MRTTLLLVTLCASSGALAGNTPVNLNGWSDESYPAVSGFAPGEWQVAADNLSVTQVNNGQPTIFYSDILAFGTDLAGVLSAGAGDNDYIGFVLGFEPGDSTNPDADYLLVDWKQGTQSFNFGAPSDITPGSTAFAGLAVSRVTGIPTADEFWGHQNFVENPGGGVEELARAVTYENTGWTDNQEYAFIFQFSPTNLKIFVDGTLEFNINGNFSNGRWGFYNFSQANVTYGSFTTAIADSDNDGLFDDTDNCQFVSNTDQRDTDGDDIGNACDPDVALPNDCVVNFLDLSEYKANFFAPGDLDTDNDGDGQTNFADLSLVKLYFFGPPGPSAIGCN